MMPIQSKKTVKKPEQNIRSGYPCYLAKKLSNKAAPKIVTEIVMSTLTLSSVLSDNSLNTIRSASCVVLNRFTAFLLLLRLKPMAKRFGPCVLYALRDQGSLRRGLCSVFQEHFYSVNTSRFANNTHLLNFMHMQEALCLLA